MRGKGPLHFKNAEGYRKFLAEIHIHGQTKHHHRTVYIGGKLHHVCHTCGSPGHKTHEHHAEHGFHGYVSEPTHFEIGEHYERERVDITPMKKHKHIHHEIGMGMNEPYGHLNLSEDPSLFLSSEQKKITGKLSGGYGLDLRI